VASPAGSERPLRVAVDAGPLLGERTGIGHVTARLLEGLGARDDVAVTGYAVRRTAGRDLAGVLPAGVAPAASWLPARVVHPLWARTDRPRIEHWTGPVDVVHAPNFVAPPARAPVVVSIHDLAFVHHLELCRPEAAHLEPQVRRALARGAVVHTGSDHVAAEIREHFDLPPERVVRVYSGIATHPADGDPAVGRALAGGDRYVLALGTIEPRKGLPGLVRAFDLLAVDDRDLRLVIAGADGWGVEALAAAITSARAAARIVRLGYVPDADHAALLSGAAALAYPSLYEGFGHPPFEAMAAGVPVVTTTAGSLPEVVGDAAALVEPGDDVALADALRRVLDDDALRAQLVARGHARADAFPWSTAIDGFVDLYRRVAARSRAVS
jgi:glycosyltransferase involved in cell wall biosynthesis